MIWNFQNLDFCGFHWGVEIVDYESIWKLKKALTQAQINLTKSSLLTTWYFASFYFECATSKLDTHWKKILIIKINFHCLLILWPRKKSDILTEVLLKMGNIMFQNNFWRSNPIFMKMFWRIYNRNAWKSKTHLVKPQVHGN